MRLLCDENVKGLGRWLRAAGYDTVIAEDGTPDDALVRRALDEDRLLLTCDRRLAAASELAGRAVLVTADGLDAAAAEIGSRIRVDWLRAPFSRCLIDNAVLRAAHPDEIARLPAPAREGAGPFMTCPACARVFWPGSHVRRMRARLERWQRS